MAKAKKAKQEDPFAPVAVDPLAPVLTVTLDVAKAFEIFTQWHVDEITTRKDARTYAVRLMRRLRGEAMVKAAKPIHILWGESPEHGQKAETYTFMTEAEREAFLYGVSEMDGWMGWQEAETEDDVWCATCGEMHLKKACKEEA